jgi:hypothetical protein
MIKNLTSLMLVFFCLQGFTQGLESSPYSGLAIGDEVPQRTVEEMSMGGVGTASSNFFNLNFNNPASLSSLRVTTFTAAGQNSASTYLDDQAEGSSSNAYLSYLAMGIPIGPKGFAEPKGGLLFGVQPRSTVGYTINDIRYDASNAPIEASLYEGSGGATRLFFGGGYEIMKGLSIGMEGEYLFGSLENSVLYQEKDVQFGSKYKNASDVEGVTFEAGAIYKKDLKRNLYLNVGANVTVGSTLDSKGTEYLYSLDNTGIGIPRDTLFNRTSRGTYKTPLKTSLGVSIGKDKKWSAEIDYSFRDAIESTGNLADYNPKLMYEAASNLSVGGFYVPRYNSISSYWHRVVYRWGANMQNTGMMIDGTGNGTEFTSIDQFGMSFGVGLPVGTQLSRLNLGFEFGQKGTTDNGLVRERFFNFRLGLTFGNKWFKPKSIN